MFKNILILLISLLLHSCAISSPSNTKSTTKPTTIKKTKETTKSNSTNQPTRQKQIDNKTESKEQKNNEVVKPNEPQQPKPKVRFKDTTTIEMEPIYASKQQNKNEEIDTNNPIKKEIELANNLLEKGEIQKAKEKFSILTSTLPYGDSLYYEAHFGEIECLIAQNNIQTAKKLLQDLLEDKNLNSETEAKTLVRLGQIECVLSNPTLAENYFSKLKTKYPRSIYIKVANCDFLKKNR